MAKTAALATALQSGGHSLLRYGLALIIAWIGAMKFTEYEAAAIQPLVASSPLTSWLYALFSVRTTSTLLGCIELAIAALITAHRLSPMLGALGSALAVPMLVTTLSFLFSLPGWEPALGGFPGLSNAGGFLVKDLLLLGAALWSFGESLAPVQWTPAKATRGASEKAAAPRRSHG